MAYTTEIVFALLVGIFFLLGLVGRISKNLHVLVSPAVQHQSILFYKSNVLLPGYVQLNPT